MVQMKVVLTTNGWFVLRYRYKYPLPHNGVGDYPPDDWNWSDWIDAPIEADGLIGDTLTKTE